MKNAEITSPFQRNSDFLPNIRCHTLLGFIYQSSQGDHLEICVNHTTKRPEGWYLIKEYKKGEPVGKPLAYEGIPVIQPVHHHNAKKDKPTSPSVPTRYIAIPGRMDIAVELENESWKW